MNPQSHGGVIGAIVEGPQYPRGMVFSYVGDRGRGGVGVLGFCHNAATLALMQTPKGKTMASDLIKHVTDATFEVDVLQSEQPILVDYWAEWCGPCKMIAPILDEISTTYDGKLKVAKMNVDENRDIPAKFGIRGIPTLMLFKGGQLAATKVGAMSKAQLTAFIDQQLA
jgi:thioredoxin 1